MKDIKQINIKNRTYFYNDWIDLKNFDAKLSKIDKLQDWHLLRRLCDCLKIDNCNNIDEMIGHFECNSVEEKNEIKYLVLDDVDGNRVSKKY